MLRSISKQWRLSRSTPGGRDRVLAFLLGLHAGLGVHRTFARRTLYWLIGQFGKRDVVVLRFITSGSVISLAMRLGNRADYLVGGEFIQGGYEAPDVAPSAIVDAGANIGTFSLAAGARFPGVPIVAYEPDEANVALLRRNLEDNGIKGEVRQMGVWSEAITMFFHAQESYTGFLSNNATNLSVECELPTISADSWLKLDIEGAEYEVLPAFFRAGMFPRFISMELHYRRERGDQLIKLARNNGYIVTGPLDIDADCINLTLSRE